jgi:hypothetical protein
MMWVALAIVALCGVYGAAMVILLGFCLWAGETEPDYDDV